MSQPHDGISGISSTAVLNSLPADKGPVFRKPETRRKKRFEILAWAENNGFIINPSKGMEQYIDNYIRFGYCPCDKTRNNCPCVESIEEVKEKGRCLCRLYWRDIKTFRRTLKDEQGTTKEDRGADRGGTAKTC